PAEVVPKWLDPLSAWTSETPASFKNGIPAHGGYILHESEVGIPDGFYVIAAANEYDVQQVSPSHTLGLLTETRDPLAAPEDRSGTRISYDTYQLLPATVTDPLDLVMTAHHDYRVFKPEQVRDPNDNL